MENIINNRYKIIEKIGAGGTSIVYKALRLTDNKLVALKLLREEYNDSDEQVDRFLRESHALSHLSHVNIVNILDVGKIASGSYYIAMEYVDGVTLKEYIKSMGRLKFEQIIDFVLQICAGIAHAHDNNIIHRDIKPQNILLAADGTIKVADFGIARVLNQNTLTMAGKDVVGSVHYISPEQARGTHVDKCSDIYSLGVVMYEMATGKLPFGGNEAITIAMKHINQLPKPPREIIPDIPPSLNDIILKCLAKDPYMRYQDIKDLENDLIHAANDPYGFTVAQNQKPAPTPMNAGPDNAAIQKPQRKRRIEMAQEKKLVRKKTTVLLLSIVAGFAALILLFAFIFSNRGTEQVSQMVKMPSVVGLHYEEATQRVREANLRVIISDAVVYSNDIPKDCVVYSRPEAGIELLANETVTLIISAGPEMVKVPPLENLTLEDAKAALEAAKLQLGEVTEQPTSEKLPGRVISQSEAVDSMVPVGTVVNIVVSKADQNTITIPNLLGMTEQLATDTISANNFKVGGIHREYNNMYPAGQVFKQEPASGTEVKKNEDISIVIWVSLGPIERYYGEITVEIPSMPYTSDLRIEYKDENGNSVLVYTAVLAADMPVETKKFNAESSSPTPRIYYVYINDALYEEITMLFYDKDGNLATPEPSETPQPTDSVED